MSFDPTPTTFRDLQDAFHTLSRRYDDLERRFHKAVSENSYLREQVNDLAAQLSSARGEWR